MRDPCMIVAEVPAGDDPANWIAVGGGFVPRIAKSPPGQWVAWHPRALRNLEWPPSSSLATLLSPLTPVTP